MGDKFERFGDVLTLNDLLALRDRKIAFGIIRNKHDDGAQTYAAVIVFPGLATAENASDILDVVTPKLDEAFQENIAKMLRELGGKKLLN